MTFPFSFGVMFGDMGHGIVVFCIGALLCFLCPMLREKAPGMEGILSIRYILLMMGLFAAFCGLIYNDFMAIPIWFFHSCYTIGERPDATDERGYKLYLAS